MTQGAMTHLSYEAADMLDICRSFEHAYGMTSEDFFARYEQCEFVGIHDGALGGILARVPQTPSPATLLSEQTH